MGNLGEAEPTMFEDDRLFSSLTELGDLERSRQLNVDENVVNELSAIWNFLNEALNRKAISNVNKCFHSLLKYTALVLLDGRYATKIEGCLKDRLQQSVQNVHPALTDFPQLTKVIDSLIVICREPWKYAKLQVVSNLKEISEMTAEVRNDLWYAEGWVFLETRLDFLSKPKKPPQDFIALTAKILHICVMKGQELYPPSTSTPTVETEDFDLFRLSYQQYLECLGMYVIFWSKNNINNLMSPKLLTDLPPSLSSKVITMLKTKCSEKLNTPALFPKIWKHNSKEMLVPLVTLLVPAAMERICEPEGVKTLLELYVDIFLENTEESEQLEKFEQILNALLLRREHIKLSDYIYSLAEVIVDKLGDNEHTRRMYINSTLRAMLKDLQELENLRATSPPDPEKLKTESIRLSHRLIKLASLFADFPKKFKELRLTAFSLNPNSQLFKEIFPETSLPSTSNQAIAVEINANGVSTDGVVDSETGEEQDEDFRLPSSLADDLDTITDKPRWGALGRMTNDEEKKVLCQKLLDEGSEFLIKEKKLEYVNVDYGLYTHLPSKYDPFDDGIERGYNIPQKRKSKGHTKGKATKNGFVKRPPLNGITRSLQLKGKAGMTARKNATSTINRKLGNANFKRGTNQTRKENIPQNLSSNENHEDSELSQVKEVKVEEKLSLIRQYLNHVQSLKEFVETNHSSAHTKRVQKKSARDIYKKRFLTPKLPRPGQFNQLPYASCTSNGQLVESPKNSLRKYPTAYSCPKTPQNVGGGLGAFGFADCEVEFRYDRMKLRNAFGFENYDAHFKRNPLPDAKETIPKTTVHEWIDVENLRGINISTSTCVTLKNTKFKFIPEIDLGFGESCLLVPSKLTDLTGKYLSLKDDAIKSKASISPSPEQRAKMLRPKDRPTMKKVLYQNKQNDQFALGGDHDPTKSEEEEKAENNVDQMQLQRSLDPEYVFGEVWEYDVVKRIIVPPSGPQRMQEAYRRNIMISEACSRMENNLSMKTYSWKEVLAKSENDDDDEQKPSLEDMHSGLFQLAPNVIFGNNGTLNLNGYPGISIPLQQCRKPGQIAISVGLDNISEVSKAKASTSLSGQRRRSVKRLSQANEQSINAPSTFNNTSNIARVSPKIGQRKSETSNNKVQSVLAIFSADKSVLAMEWMKKCLPDTEVKSGLVGLKKVKSAPQTENESTETSSSDDTRSRRAKSTGTKNGVRGYQYYSDEAVHRAFLDMCNYGITMRSAAEKYGIARSALCKRLKVKGLRVDGKLIIPKELRALVTSITPSDAEVTKRSFQEQLSDCDLLCALAAVMFSHTSRKKAAKHYGVSRDTLDSELRKRHYHRKTKQRVVPKSKRKKNRPRQKSKKGVSAQNGNIEAKGDTATNESEKSSQNPPESATESSNSPPPSEPPPEEAIPKPKVSYVFNIPMLHNPSVRTASEKLSGKALPLMSAAETPSPIGDAELPAILPENKVTETDNVALDSNDVDMTGKRQILDEITGAFILVPDVPEVVEENTESLQDPFPESEREEENDSCSRDTLWDDSFKPLENLDHRTNIDPNSEFDNTQFDTTPTGESVTSVDPVPPTIEVIEARSDSKSSAEDICTLQKQKYGILECYVNLKKFDATSTSRIKRAKLHLESEKQSSDSSNSSGSETVAEVAEIAEVKRSNRIKQRPVKLDFTTGAPVEVRVPVDVNKSDSPKQKLDSNSKSQSTTSGSQKNILVGIKPKRKVENVSTNSKIREKSQSNKKRKIVKEKENLLPVVSDATPNVTTKVKEVTARSVARKRTRPRNNSGARKNKSPPPRKISKRNNVDVSKEEMEITDESELDEDESEDSDPNFDNNNEDPDYQPEEIPEDEMDEMSPKSLPEVEIVLVPPPPLVGISRTLTPTPSVSHSLTGKRPLPKLTRRPGSQSQSVQVAVTPQTNNVAINGVRNIGATSIRPIIINAKIDAPTLSLAIQQPKSQRGKILPTSQAKVNPNSTIMVNPQRRLTQKAFAHPLHEDPLASKPSPDVIEIDLCSDSDTEAEDTSTQVRTNTSIRTKSARRQCSTPRSVAVVSTQPLEPLSSDYLVCEPIIGTSNINESEQHKSGQDSDTDVESLTEGDLGLQSDLEPSDTESHSEAIEIDDEEPAVEVDTFYNEHMTLAPSVGNDIDEQPEKIVPDAEDDDSQTYYYINGEVPLINIEAILPPQESHKQAESSHDIPPADIEHIFEQNENSIMPNSPENYDHEDADIESTTATATEIVAQVPDPCHEVQISTPQYLNPISEEVLQLPPHSQSPLIETRRSPTISSIEAEFLFLFESESEIEEEMFEDEPQLYCNSIDHVTQPAACVPTLQNPEQQTTQSYPPFLLPAHQENANFVGVIPNQHRNVNYVEPNASLPVVISNELCLTLDNDPDSDSHPVLEAGRATSSDNNVSEAELRVHPEVPVGEDSETVCDTNAQMCIFEDPQKEDEDEEESPTFSPCEAATSPKSPYDDDDIDMRPTTPDPQIGDEVTHIRQESVPEEEVSQEIELTVENVMEETKIPEDQVFQETELVVEEDATDATVLDDLGESPQELEITQSASIEANANGGMEVPVSVSDGLVEDDETPTYLSYDSEIARDEADRFGTAPCFSAKDLRESGIGMDGMELPSQSSTKSSNDLLPAAESNEITSVANDQPPVEELSDEVNPNQSNDAPPLPVEELSDEANSIQSTDPPPVIELSIDPSPPILEPVEDIPIRNSDESNEPPKLYKFDHDVIEI